MSSVPGTALYPGEVSGQDRHGPVLHRPRSSKGKRDWGRGTGGQQPGKDRTEVSTKMLVSAWFGEIRKISLEEKQLILKTAA